MPHIPFFAVRHEPPPMLRSTLMVLSFLLPLGIWCAFSYVPFLWHPLMQLEIGGGPVFAVGDRIPRASFAELEKAEAAWFAAYQEHGAQVPGEEAFVVRAGAEPTPAGRRLQRSNSKAVFSYAPALIAAGRLSIDDERDAKAIIGALRNWQAEDFASGDWACSPENIARMSALLAAVPDDGSLPQDAVLPGAAPQGLRANPVFLPAPHQVGVALISAFTTPPPRDDDPWLHERLLHSLWVVVKGFGLALVIGLPLGIVAGAFPAMARLIEPITNFVGYIPPPAFAALLVAIFGLADGPKVGIVFIASVFPMVVMVANTVRSLDTALLEAAQTLGAKRRSLITRVIIPGSLPRIFEDVRVLLALGWTILIIAEITGEKSGLSAYMEQQGRYRHYENVFAAMLIIGSLGLFVDRLLAGLRLMLFPWLDKEAPSWMRGTWWLLSYLPRMAARDMEDRQAAVDAQLASRREHASELETRGASG